MAGFFGMFNYEKPGPGVDKGPHRKKAFVVFFEILGRKIWKLMTVNLLYILFSIPFLTNGLAQVGMTYVTRNFAREKHAFVWGDFIDTIKKNWKQALPVGIINGLITGVLLFNIYCYLQQEGILMIVLLALTGALFIVFTFTKNYIYMMMVTFSLNIRQLYKNSMVFSGVIGLKPNLIVLAVDILFYVAAFFALQNAVGLLFVFMVYMLIYPAFRSLLVQFCIFPVIEKHMIRPYYEEHPEADRKLLRNLNIQWGEELATQEGQTPEQAEDEPVFKDMGRTKTEEEEEQTPARTIPRQYSEREMRHLENKRRRNRDEDDDGTI